MSHADPTPADVARVEAMLEPLAERERDLAAMAAVEPSPLEEIPLALREKLLGPQRGSAVRVELLYDDAVLLGKVERYDVEEDTLEVDFYGWYGEFQITHSVARVTLASTGQVITSEDATLPAVGTPTGS